MTAALYRVVDIFLFAFSAWTLAYHAVFVSRLPAWSGFLFFVVFLAALAVVSRVLARRKKHGSVQFSHVKSLPFLGPNRTRATALAFASIAVGLFAVCVSRPDADDFSFFHRALYQVGRLSEPFFNVDTAHEIGGLPPISIAHTLTSYEPGIALFASLFRVDALWAYQNLASLVVGMFLPVIFFLLYRHFRLTFSAAYLGVVFAVIFLLIDGNLHRSFGNFTLVRAWQGKTILVTLLIPLIMLFTLRVLARPSSDRILRLFLASICATGLSSSGLFMVPVQVFGISLGYALSYGLSKRRLARIIKANLAIAYCLFVALGVWLYTVINPMDTSVWIQGWVDGNSWLGSLTLVFGDWTSIARNVAILILVPVISLSPPLRRLVPLMTAAFVLIFATPVTSSLFMDTVTPGGYWRLAYLFPLPWCFGLIATTSPASLRGDTRPVRNLKISGIALSLCLVVSAYQTSVLEGDAVFLESPRGYKFPPQEMQFVNDVLKAGVEPLGEKVMLAPESIVVVAGLIYPDLRFISSRPLETKHIFANSGNSDDGEIRIRAQSFVANCNGAGVSVSEFLQVFERGIDIVVSKNCEIEEDQLIARILKAADIPFVLAGCDANYCLYLIKRN